MISGKYDDWVEDFSEFKNRREAEERKGRKGALNPDWVSEVIVDCPANSILQVENENNGDLNGENKTLDNDIYVGYCMGFDFSIHRISPSRNNSPLVNFSKNSVCNSFNFHNLADAWRKAFHH